jgi:DNA helicase-2/ATP-dependent DNA helicase PcrA
VTIRPSPEQAAVIAAPLAPLRVTAGAGTGKTTTMALRLAALVEHGAVEPEEALGITFTNKAAEELADRLRASLPGFARAGREVEVTTYHGFAHGLLREFGPIVGVDRESGVVTPGYARQLLRESLGAAPRAALDLTVPGRRVDELVLLAGRLGDHLRDTADLRRAPGGDEECRARRLEMADVLDDYAERKQALGIVDYADLISRAHALAAGHPAVAAAVRDRYRVVLLDEYQDTNPAQRELLRSVFGGGFPVTAVGDPDQTVYEWRGASLENFAAFGEHFAGPDGTPAATLPLSHNRRSARRIVDLANTMRSEISRPSGLDRLRPVESAPEGKVVAAWFRDAVSEARWIAAEVARLHDEEGAAWSDVGILFRRHRQMGLVRDALQEQGVPVEVAALGGLLEVPEVADLHAWLRVLGRPDDAPALLRILLGAHYRLGLADLAPLTRRLEPPGTGGDDGEGAGWAMLEAIDEGAGGVRPEAAGRLLEFRDRYRRLLREAQSVSLVELCRRILDVTGAWPEVEALDDSARLSARLNLYRFLDLAEAWSPLEGSPSLDAFLDYLDLLVEEHATDELDTARVGGEDAVSLITAHRAKGLEWPIVVLPALCAGTFPGRPLVLEDPDVHPQFIPEELRLDLAWAGPLPNDPDERKEALRARHADQEWRVAYVAVTRAERMLIATGAAWYTERRPRQPSPLLEMARAVEGATVAEWAADPGDPPGRLRLPPGGATDADAAFPEGWREDLRRSIDDPGHPGRRAASLGISPSYDAAVDQLHLVLDGLPDPAPAPDAGAGLRTSVTGLVSFATCPRQYAWSEVDRLPRRPSAARRRGIDLHRRIELHNRGVAALEEAGPGFYDLEEADAGPVEGGFAAFAASRFAAERPRLVEAPFDLKVGDARIAGRIDAVYEPEAGLWEVIDFKSGRRSDHPALRTQLEAYALAAAEAGLAAEPPEHIRVAFVYLGGGFEEVAEEVDGGWLEAARAHLAALVAGATGGDYPATPSPACRRCDFARFCDPGRAWLEAQP